MTSGVDPCCRSGWAFGHDRKFGSVSSVFFYFGPWKSQTEVLPKKTRTDRSVFGLLIRFFGCNRARPTTKKTRGKDDCSREEEREWAALASKRRGSALSIPHPRATAMPSGSTGRAVVGWWRPRPSLSEQRRRPPASLVQEQQAPLVVESAKAAATPGAHLSSTWPWESKERWDRIAVMNGRQTHVIERDRHETGDRWMNERIRFWVFWRSLPWSVRVNRLTNADDRVPDITIGFQQLETEQRTEDRMFGLFGLGLGPFGFGLRSRVFLPRLSCRCSAVRWQGEWMTGGNPGTGPTTSIN
jgi:hypothetical protein